MTKVLGTKRLFSNADDAECMEFLEGVCDIVAIPEYQKLRGFTHHMYTTRYQHCLNVAWYSYLMAKRAGLDSISCARGAMMHDFYLYDTRRDLLPIAGKHLKIHPAIALKNAQKYFTLNEVETDCIIHHMWPKVAGRPTTKEGYIVTVADKYAASLEWCSHQVYAVPRVIGAVFAGISGNTQTVRSDK